MALRVGEQICISIHSLRMEGDSRRETAAFMADYFNPLPPHGGRRPLTDMVTVEAPISIHSLRMEGDVNSDDHLRHGVAISIHSLRMEGDSGKKTVKHIVRGYFNPLPPHGGRPIGTNDGGPDKAISIHSLRMEGDVIKPSIETDPEVFQSTPSAWRETRGSEAGQMVLPISIHSLRMEGDRNGRGRHGNHGISIHSLRMEGD